MNFRLSSTSQWVLSGLLLTGSCEAFFRLAFPFEGGIFEELILRHDKPTSFLVALVLLAGSLLTRFEFDVDRAVTNISRNRFVIAAGFWLFLVAGNILLYQQHPLSMDEYAAVLQSQIFSGGQMSAHVPPSLIDWLVPRPFQNYFLIVNRGTGEVASGYWPGFSILLAPFVWLGLPSGCNATVAACATLVAGRIAYDVTTDERARGWTILFFVASPMFVLNGISFYSMPAHLLFNLCFVWLLLEQTPARLFLAGITGSFALVLHNPFPHLLFAAPWILWLIIRPARLKNITLLAAGYIPLTIVLGAGWLHVLESIRRPIGAAPELGSQMAHAASAGAWILKTLAELTRPFKCPDESTSIFRVAELCKLLLWSVPLMPVFAWLGALRLGRGKLMVMGWSFLATFFGYFLLPVNQGHGWGARYLFSAWGVLAILAATWLVSNSSISPIQRGNPIARFSFSLCLMSVLGLMAWRGWQVSSFIDQHLAQRPPFPADLPSIVFIRNGYYALDLVQNDPFLHGQSLIVRSHGREEDAKLAMKLLPGATVHASTKNGWTYVGTSGQVFSFP